MDNRTITAVKLMDIYIFNCSRFYELYLDPAIAASGKGDKERANQLINRCISAAAEMVRDYDHQRVNQHDRAEVYDLVNYYVNDCVSYEARK